MGTTGDEDFAARFSSWTGFFRDAAWWIWLIVGGCVFLFSFVQGRVEESASRTFLLVLFAVLASALAIALAIRAFKYHRRWLRMCDATRHVHMLTHQLRNQIGDVSMGPLPDGEDPPATDGDMVAEQKLMLQDIASGAARAFEALSGRKCCACVLLPCDPPEGEAGDALKTVVYSQNTDAKRVESAKPHTRGLAFLALHSDRPLIRNNYSKDSEFSPNRSDWENWYGSGIMAHFKVGGKPWGVFAIDSTRENVFDKKWSEMACAFADACAMVLSMRAYD